MIKYLFFLLAFLPGVAFAHLDGEAIIDNGYRVELGQDREELVVNENLSFSLALESLEGERVLETKAWVRLSLEDQVIFSSTDLQTNDGTIDFSFSLKEPGGYELLARVEDLEKQEQATGNFVLEIKSEEVQEVVSQEQSQPMAALLLSLSIFTLLVGIVIGKRFAK